MNLIAVIGAAGQLASDLLPRLGPRGVGLSHQEIDVTSPQSLAAALDSGSWAAVINCAAYNLVDRAEAEPETAFAVNALGVRNLAAWCGTHAVPLLHVSTDFVFGSEKQRATPYRETDLPGPLSVYGMSKLTGEYFVQALCSRYWIVRTCGLYGRQATRSKGNFVETMRRLSAERSELRIVADQRCTPTSTRDLSAVLARLVESSDYGLYHATNAGDCSWAEFATEILRRIGSQTAVIPITAAEYGAPAPRPAYSVLDSEKIQAATGLTLRPWQEALAEYLQG